MMPNNLLKLPIKDEEEIKKLLPHRKPMLMVDALKYFDGKNGIAELTILANNIFIKESHFSETGLIEHMAQTAALFIGYKHLSMNLPIQEGFIAAIKNLNIEVLPNLNVTISTNVELTYEVGSLSIVNLTSFINHKKIASAEMNLVLNEQR